MFPMETRRSGPANGSGSRMTACRTVKMAVFAPMHSARVRSAVIVKAFSVQSSFKPKRRSGSIKLNTLDLGKGCKNGLARVILNWNFGPAVNHERIQGNFPPFHL